MPLDLFPYQETGSAFIGARSRAGLHDEMGIGKTAQVIRAADDMRARRGIIVCPGSIRTNWQGEFRKFARHDYRVCVAKNVHDYVAWKRGHFHIMATSYEQAAKWSRDIYDTGEILDFVAVDEGHYCKNPRALRTQALFGPNCDGQYGLINWARHAWHVTGTLEPNDPLDCYTFLRMCRATTLDVDAFTRRYFYSNRSTWGSRQAVRPEGRDELLYLIDNNRIRRTLDQVGVQLPPVFLTECLVDGDTDDIKRMLLEYPGLEDSIVGAVQAGGLSFLDAQHIATLRRLIGEAKAVPYAYMLADELEANPGHKRVVFGNHVDALGMVHNYMLKRGFGSILLRNEKDATVAVDRFNNDPSVRVVFGNMRSAGVGLNMTSSDQIDILESDWAPAPNAQAIKRVHRIGQLSDKVMARFITLARSLDEVINRIVADKTAAIAELEGSAMLASPLTLH
jgi:SWI/SNF-related matrix-associated actin-dependent regulator 1 of chromatin subfamily A